MTEDFYDLLDVPPDASQDEIKEAYREQVRVYHPDLNDDDRAQAQFTAIKRANDILGDPVERQAYDRLGHEEYVSKRTSGIPSPDVWQTDDTGTDSAETAATATAAAGTGGNSSRGGSGGAASSTSRTATGTGSRTSASTGTGTGGGTGGASTTRGAGGGRNTGSADGGTARGTTRSGRHASRSESTADGGWLGENPVVRWWRRQNFTLPLIWLSVLVYLAGLAHFALENESGLETLWAELTAVGADLGGVHAVLSSSRYGIDSSPAYLSGVEFVAPPLEPQLWYAALAGAVGLTLLAMLAVRASRDRETWGPMSIDEVIVLALALAATTGAVGGPLLAGAVLMPVLFALIVRHTRRGPGWEPSYLYVFPVLAPLAGVTIARAGEATLATDLVAFVILPLIGALGLPLRATIRKRFGR